MVGCQAGEVAEVERYCNQRDQQRRPLRAVVASTDCSSRPSVGAGPSRLQWPQVPPSWVGARGPSEGACGRWPPGAVVAAGAAAVGAAGRAWRVWAAAGCAGAAVEDGHRPPMAAGHH